MIVEIEGIHVKLIYSEGNMVSLIDYDDQLMTVRIPALLPKNELIEIVKIFKKKKVSNDQQSYQGDHLTLFQKQIPIRFRNSNSKEAFLKENIIYIPITQANLVQNERYIEKLKQSLLKNLIMKSVGKWEEKLNILTSEIKFRKLKTKYYSTCLKTNCICFNTLLINQTIELIDYLTLDALLSISKIKTNENEAFKNKHIPNWKYYQRIVDHESKYRHINS